MIRASIDIGSNSVLLLVAELDVTLKKITKEIINLSFVTSLGKDLDKNKMFLPESMEATFKALEAYALELKKIGMNPASVIVTATEASRVALNAPLFYERIKKELGFSVQVISAKEEAYYTALGVVSGLDSSSNESIVVMDMGGASTELIEITTNPFNIKSSISFPVGSVRATDWKRNGEFHHKMSEILETDVSTFCCRELLCVAGSMTSLASIYKGCIEFDDRKIDGMTIEFSSFKKFSYDLMNTNVDNLLLLFPYLGKRAPMLASASEVALMIGEKLKVDNLRISTRGLRYGTLIQGDLNGRD